MRPKASGSEFTVTSIASRRRLSCLSLLVNFQSFTVIYNFGIRVAFLLVVERQHIGGCYGTGYRVLYSGAVSQAGEVDPGGRAGQGA